MASFVVLERPGRPGTGPTAEAVFVRDSFRFLAFLVPPVWLLVNRLWLEAFCVFAAALCLGFGAQAAGLGPFAPAFSLLLGLYVGFEGPGLRIAALRRRGWTEAGVVEAGSAAEAEIRYYAGELDIKDGVPPAKPGNPWAPPAAALRSSQGSPPALGLLGYMGGR